MSLPARRVDDFGSRVPPEMRRKLEIRKKAQERRGRKFQIRQRRQLEPRQLERKGMRWFRDRYNLLISLIEERLIARLPALLGEDQSFIPTIPKRTDALSDETSTIIEGVKVEFARRLTEGELRSFASNLGVAVTEHNLRELNKTTRAALAVDVFQGEPFLQSQMQNYVEQNVGLIKSADEKYFGEIQETVFRGARQGLPTKEISRKIRERGEVAKSRADLIARDQVNKFNGQLSKLRQTNLGVSRYRWRTSLDKRVRPAHIVRENKVFSWDDPPSDGHPGEPINCRCYAEPILEDLIEG